MYERATIRSASDLFLPISRRAEHGTYFVRLGNDSPANREAIWEYYQAVSRKGVLIDELLGNPDSRQLAYYSEQMGDAFEPTAVFIETTLSKWMPRISAAQRKQIAQAINDKLEEMTRSGKPPSTLRNVFMKMMCWLYYRFERIIDSLGDDDPPRVLYIGTAVTAHEMYFLRMIRRMGADLMLIETNGDASYLKTDPQSVSSQLLDWPGKPFTPDFSWKALYKEMSSRQPAKPVVQKPAAPAPQRPVITPQAAPRSASPRPQLQPPVRSSVPGAPLQPVGGSGSAAALLEQRLPKPAQTACTNAWMKQAEVNQLLTPPASRGSDPAFFCNAYIRASGVKSKVTYLNELYTMYGSLKNSGRQIVVVDGQLPDAAPEEIAAIRRHNYRSMEDMILDLAGNLPASAHTVLQQQIQYAFRVVVADEAKSEPNLNKLMNHAVKLLCLIRRYQPELFAGWRPGTLPCLILNGGCRDLDDCMYIRFLSMLPCDILILAPDLQRPCILEDERLLRLENPDSLVLQPFPKDSSKLQMRTVASHAEEELGTILYNDSGLYRNRQFGLANSIILQTTYDELFILWGEAPNFRPNFSTDNGRVNLPVLYATVSGVENSNTLAYWQKIKKLINEPQTILMKGLSFDGHSSQPGALASVAVKSLRNGRISRKLLEEDRNYPFKLLSDEMQDHIFEKLQLMLDRRLIRGTFENGTEYTVISTVLGMSKELLRLLHGFDFTKKNPKIVCIHTREEPARLEDAIMFTFLSLVGFDLVLFVPTGFKTIESFLNDHLPVQHQIGAYMYDLHTPDFRTIPEPKSSWVQKLFRR